MVYTKRENLEKQHTTKSALVQWLGFHAFTVAAGVRFPDAELFLIFFKKIFYSIKYMDDYVN